MLTERQQQILQIVVEHYISEAEPVGSRMVSKRGGMPYSPATIRNEMADLEEMGYLEQPHTSAGRIPSEKGYRYYVDRLVQPTPISWQKVRELKQLLSEKMVHTEQSMQQTAEILSNVTNYTTFVLGPEAYHASLKSLQLIPITDETAVVIIVTNTGHVEHHKITIPDGIPRNEMERLVNLLNAKLYQVPLVQLKSRLRQEIADEIRRHLTAYEAWMNFLESLLAVRKSAERVYLSGTAKILSHPEFQDVNKVRALFEWLENQEALVSLLEDSRAGIQVHIGQENKVEAMNECSLITFSHIVNGTLFGTIGILGPTRMHYNKVIGLLTTLSGDLTNLFQRWYQAGA
ncbi:MAG: heat-inducible transcriptional repressor HrcA [Bacillaceae bacterium G1]|nr:heat-inducible transcriptional repressor HrcA [Bacillota bacterium]OJF18420.1 MAG: heat-inducible transcriptional repressor HrcA [Bacillaceae bacterium G1]